MNIYLFTAIILLFTLIIGSWLKRFRVPTVFSALFIGLLLSLNNSFFGITNSDIFIYLAEVGMFLLLFMIGLEIDLDEILRQGKFITKLAFWLVIAESILGALFIHYVFRINWFASILTASSFATVGEALLIPILDEFKLVSSKFAQTLLGIGTLDDIAELLTLIIASFYLGVSVTSYSIPVAFNVILLGFLFLVPFLLYRYHSEVRSFNFDNKANLFLFSIVLLFLFVGIASLVEAAAIGAILGGVTLSSTLSKESKKELKEILKILSYGFFVPIFFLSVGAAVDLNYLYSEPILIILILLITTLTKVVTSYIFAKPVMGTQKAFLLGVGLSVKFSSSIVIITMLFTKHIITIELYSILIGSMILSQFLIPITFTTLLKKWNLKFEIVDGK